MRKYFLHKKFNNSLSTLTFSLLNGLTRTQLSYMQPLPHFPVNTHTHTLSHTLTLTHSHALSHFLTVYLSHTHTHSIEDGHVIPGLIHKCYLAKKNGTYDLYMISVCSNHQSTLSHCIFLDFNYDLCA